MRKARTNLLLLLSSSSSSSSSLLSYLTNLEFSRQIFEKSSNIKSHENISSGSRVVACLTTDGRTDMTKLTVAFRKYILNPAINPPDHSSGYIVCLLIAFKMSTKILTPSQPPTHRRMVSQCTDQVILLNKIPLLKSNQCTCCVNPN
jgi:hypothetical protein